VDCRGGDLGGMTDPDLRTVGDLLDRIEGASPEQRRQIADEAREAAGLTSFTEIEANQKQAEELRWPPTPPSSGSRDENGCAIQKCPHCEAVSSPKARCARRPRLVGIATHTDTSPNPAISTRRTT
jgi:hypothetical protein